MSSSAGTPLVLDTFASLHLGLPVYRLVQLDRAAEAVASVMNRPSLVEAKIPVGSVAAIASLTELGFRVVDTGIQLDAPSSRVASRVASEAGASTVRLARCGDRSDVEALAARTMVTSRYHLDPKIDPARASRLKSAWAGNYFEGARGQQLLVAEYEGAIAGFLQVLERDEVGTIDMIGLDPALRGTGALAGLIDGWLQRSSQLARLLVGTQASNIRSLRAYERLGFRVSATTFVLHYHSASTS